MVVWLRLQGVPCIHSCSVSLVVCLSPPRFRLQCRNGLNFSNFRRRLKFQFYAFGLGVDRKVRQLKSVKTGQHHQAQKARLKGWTPPGSSASLSIITRKRGRHRSRPHPTFVRLRQWSDYHAIILASGTRRRWAKRSVESL